MHSIRILRLSLSIVFLATACAVADRPAERTAVCSTTQVADFARAVAGDDWHVISILGPSQDPHMFQITPEATRLVAAADVCFDNGMHLEGGDWMRVVAQQEGSPIVSCTDGIVPLQIIEDGNTKEVDDPHAWFSVKNAVRYVANIQQTFCELDPDNCGKYKARAELYCDQLRALHHWIEQQISAIPADQRVLVTSHDAFNYFCRDYQLVSAAPVGWSTKDMGVAVTPQRRQEVIDSIRSQGVRALFVETSVNKELIQTIADEAGVRIGGELYSDAMGAAGTAGETYIGMMRENVLTIVAALSNDKAAATSPTNP